MKTDKILEIFNILDLDRSGTLTLDEFRGMAKNDQAKRLFKNLVKKMRDERA